VPDARAARRLQAMQDCEPDPCGLARRQRAGLGDDLQQGPGRNVFHDGPRMLTAGEHVEDPDDVRVPDPGRARASRTIQVRTSVCSARVRPSGIVHF
jgi:hypothetical protein